MSKISTQLPRILGIGAALLVPAIAVGALSLTSFQAGQQLSAADLNTNFTAIRDGIEAQETLIASLQASVTSLQDKVESLEGTVIELEARTPGDMVVLANSERSISPVVEATPLRVWQTRAAGVVVVVPVGNSFEDIGFSISTGDDRSGSCPAPECYTLARTPFPGTPMSVPIQANALFTIRGTFNGSQGQLNIFFVPLTNDGTPTLVN